MTKMNILRMEFSIVENVTGPCGITFDLFIRLVLKSEKERRLCYFYM